MIHISKKSLNNFLKNPENGEIIIEKDNPNYKDLIYDDVLFYYFFHKEFVHFVTPTITDKKNKR